MRIGLFTEQDSRAEGSLAATVDALVAHCPFDASIIEYSAPATLKALLCTRDLVSRAAGDRIDVVHVATTGPLAMVALLIASSFGLPLIGSCPLPAPDASGPLKAYLRALARQTRRLLVTSMAARARLIAAGISASKIILWRPGVDTSMFAPTKRSGALRERWGVSDARPAVIYAGVIADDRGTQRLLCLEAQLHRTRPMHRLIIAGDGRNRDELQARCPHALFLGTVPRAEMPQVLASADLFVCPNESASTNLAVLEAQASGLPVVVMERGSACERVSESSAVVCRSQADFVVETAALVRTGLRRSAIGLAAREYAVRQEWAAGLTSVYAEYRAAAEISRVRRDLKPTLIPQGRRF